LLLRLTCSSLALVGCGDGQEELEFWGQFFFTVEPVGKVNAADAAVCVDLYAQCLNVVGAVGAAREIREVKLNLVPALVEPHGHGADEWLDSGGGLIVASPKSPAHVFVV